MHLLTSMLVGELLLGGTLLRGRKVPKAGFDLKHVLPGRVRFMVPILVGDEVAATSLASVLAKLDGVTETKGDARTGSMLVRFTDSESNRHEIIGLVNAFVKRKQAQADPPATPTAAGDGPILRQQIKELGRSLNTTVQQETQNLTDLHTLAGVGIGLWGLKTLLAPGVRGRLPGLTWLYWSYNLLRQPSPQPGVTPGDTGPTNTAEADA